MTTSPPVQLLEELLSELRAQFGPRLAIEVDAAAGGTFTRLRPSRPGALPVTWDMSGDELVLSAGHHGGRWELGLSTEGVAFVREIVASVAAGRVTETFGHRRSRVQIELADGTTETETGYGPGAWLPQPGWRRHGRKVRYEPW